MVQVTSLLGSRICWIIIRFFAERPTGEFSQTEIIKELGIAKLSAIKWMDVLEKSRIVLMRQAGRSNLYRLNKESTAVRQIKVLSTISHLLPEIAKVGAKAYLFGSAARGEDDEKSDIDILIIGDDPSAIDRVRKIDRRIKVTFFTPQAWSRIARDDPAFYERVEKDKIRMIE